MMSKIPHSNQRLHTQAIEPKIWRNEPMLEVVTSGFQTWVFCVPGQCSIHCTTALSGTDASTGVQVGRRGADNVLGLLTHAQQPALPAGSPLEKVPTHAGHHRTCLLWKTGVENYQNVSKNWKRRHRKPVKAELRRASFRLPSRDAPPSNDAPPTGSCRLIGRQSNPVLNLCWTRKVFGDNTWFRPYSMEIDDLLNWMGNLAWQGSLLEFSPKEAIIFQFFLLFLLITPHHIL
ncbi:uncharacterized protein [Saccopteryx bilineata]|uniref:uncharacterized protein n=1 Tax=Saccopteryx bilineata TaxID=59482 RepID=UPI00338EA990